MSGYGEFDIPNNDLTWLGDNEPVMGSTDRPVEPPDGSDGDTINRMPKELLDNNLKNLENINELDLRLNDVKNTVATASQIQYLQSTINSVSGGAVSAANDQLQINLISAISKVMTPSSTTWNFNTGDFADIPTNVKAIFGTFMMDCAAGDYDVVIGIQMNGQTVARVTKGVDNLTESFGNGGFFLHTQNDAVFSSVSLTFELNNINITNSEINFQIMGYIV